MRFPVYITTRTFRDKSGSAITFRERRLLQQTPEDRVIAVVEAPSGSHIRRRRDHLGEEQLLVPLSDSLWSRLLRHYMVIPAKYVIGKARLGECGLALVEDRDEGP